jgi:hypothetical protein
MVVLPAGSGDPGGDVHLPSPTPISIDLTDQTRDLAGQGDLATEGGILRLSFVLKARLAHHESVSRCFDDNPDKQERLNRDSTVTMKRREYLSRPTRPMALTSGSTVGTSPLSCDQGRKSHGTIET